MLIKALCDYADKREKGRKEKIIPEGWCEQNVHFQINLSSDGTIVSIVDIRESDKVKQKNGKEKTVVSPGKATLPVRTEKPGIESNTIEHRPLYIFGLEYDKEGFTQTGKAKKSHEAFVAHEMEFFENLDSEICVAYKNFIRKWNPEAETGNVELLKLGKEYKGAYFQFALTGERGRLQEDKQFYEKYNRLVLEKAKASDDTDLLVCGVTGEKLPAARIHKKIKFPGGLSTGCVLVGMKESAYESYGKTQSYNSNISEKAMKKYTSTFNMLLDDSRHRVLMDDLVIVFFAMKEDDSAECSFLCDWITPSASDTEKSLESMFEKAAGGAAGNTEFTVDREVTFYVAGFTANSSRICQKFIYRDKFGKMIDNLMQHQRDLQIDGDRRNPVYFSFIRKELISPKSSNEKVSPPLMTNIILAAINGTAYPVALLETIVRRVKTDSDDPKNHFYKINNTRAGIIKACLNRKQKKEEITMSLNLENKNSAYLCGRLFAVYEKIQRDSVEGELNRTIKDAYFSSACSRPSAIMPKLAHLSQNHLHKLSNDSAKRNSVSYYNKLVGEIVDGLDGEFPQTLDLDDQGRFIVGYYQQNKALYTSNKNKLENEKNNGNSVNDENNGNDGNSVNDENNGNG